MVYAIKLQENVNVKHHMRVRTVVVRIVWEKMDSLYSGVPNKHTGSNKSIGWVFSGTIAPSSV